MINFKILNWAHWACHLPGQRLSRSDKINLLRWIPRTFAIELKIEFFQISKRPSMMSLYDYLDDFPDLNEDIDSKIITRPTGIRTLNDIDPMEYLNGDDDIFWWLIYYESLTNKTSLNCLKESPNKCIEHVVLQKCHVRLWRITWLDKRTWLS